MDRPRLPLRHQAQAVSEPCPGVLQTHVQHRAGPGPAAEEGRSPADLVGQIQHQPALADLAGAGEDVQALAQQPLHQELLLWKLHPQQLSRAHGLQGGDLHPQGPVDVPDGRGLVVAGDLQHHVVQGVPGGAAVRASLALAALPQIARQQRTQFSPVLPDRFLFHSILLSKLSIT